MLTWRRCASGVSASNCSGLMTPKGFENRAFRNTDPVSLIARSVSARTSYPALARAGQCSFATRSAGLAGEAVTAVVSLARVQDEFGRPGRNSHRIGDGNANERLKAVGPGMSLRFGA